MLDLKEAAAKEIQRSPSFVIHGASSAPMQIFLEENGSLSENAWADKWEIVSSDQTKSLSLKFFKEEAVLCILLLDREGIFKGRNRQKRGFIQAFATTNTDLWQKLGNPIKYYQSTEVKDEDSGFTYDDVLAPAQDWKFLEDFTIVDFMEELPADLSLAIAIVGCNRKTYFEQTVKSIAQNPEFKRTPVFVFLDRPFERGEQHLIEEQFEILKSYNKENLTFIVRPKNVGCGKNIIDVRRQLFDNLGFEKVFIFEDDMIVAPNYISLTLNLLKSAQEKYSNVGVAQAWEPCTLSQKGKFKFREGYRTTFNNLWGYCMTKDCWDQIKSFMYRYEKLFLFPKYSRRPNRSIRKWFRHQLATEPLKKENALETSFSRPDVRAYLNAPPTGQDAATIHAMYFNNIARVATVVNRAQYIGQAGIHMNPEMFRRMRLHETVIEEISQDEHTKKFSLIEAAVEEPEKAVLEGEKIPFTFQDKS